MVGVWYGRLAVDRCGRCTCCVAHVVVLIDLHGGGVWSTSSAAPPYLPEARGGRAELVEGAHDIHFFNPFPTPFMYT